MEAEVKDNVISDVESSFYNSIYKLPLRLFIRCSVDKDLAALIISGNPSLVQLTEAWENILDQYSLAIGNSSYDRVVAVFREVNRVAITINQIELLISTLRRYYIPLFAKELNKLLRVSFKFDPSNAKEYDNLLNRCETRSRTYYLELEIKRREYAALQQKQTSNKPQTLEDFQSVLITLSDYVQYRISDDITVYEYTERIKRLNKEISTIKSKENERAINR